MSFVFRILCLPLLFSEKKMNEKQGRLLRNILEGLNGSAGHTLFYTLIGFWESDSVRSSGQGFGSFYEVGGQYNCSAHS